MSIQKPSDDGNVSAPKNVSEHAGKIVDAILGQHYSQKTIEDRIDGKLSPQAILLLDVHLSRCVDCEHLKRFIEDQRREGSSVSAS